MWAIMFSLWLVSCGATFFFKNHLSFSAAFFSKRVFFEDWFLNATVILVYWLTHRKKVRADQSASSWQGTYCIQQSRLINQKRHYLYLILCKHSTYIGTILIVWSISSDMLGVWCEDLGRLLLLRHQKQRNDTQKTVGYPGQPNKISQVSNQMNPMNALNPLANKYV